MAEKTYLLKLSALTADGVEVTMNLRFNKKPSQASAKGWKKAWRKKFQDKTVEDVIEMLARRKG